MTRRILVLTFVARLATAVALAGCAHVVAPGVRAYVPAPPTIAGAVSGSETFTGAGGIALYGRWWKPKGAVRAVVVVQHGLNDHGDRYFHLAQVLVARGYAVYAMDLRGHGRSAGPRVEVDRFHDYLDDEAIWISRIREKEPGAPVFVFGHSMGGLIMTIYGEEHAREVAGVILSAPALGLDAQPIKVAAIGLARYLGAPGSMLPQHDADFSRDAVVVYDMGKDPLLTHADGPTHTAVELIDGIRVAWAGADRLTEPLLVLHGTADKLTSPAASRDFVARAAATDKRHVAIPDAWHDLAHDPARATFEDTIAAWLDAHVAAPVAAASATSGDPAAAAAGERATTSSVDALGAETIGAGATQPEHLPGEARPSAASVELRGVIGAHWATSDSGVGVGYSLAASIGWHVEGALTFRHDELLPAGVAVRIGRAGQVALASGISYTRQPSVTAIPARISLDLPAGPLHVFARATASWVVNGPSPPSRTLGADLLDATVALRLGGDHDYWSRVSAGAGPYLGATWSRAAGVDTWGLALGLELWGVR